MKIKAIYNLIKKWDRDSGHVWHLLPYHRYDLSKRDKKRRKKIKNRFSKTYKYIQGLEMRCWQCNVRWTPSDFKKTRSSSAMKKHYIGLALKRATLTTDPDADALHCDTYKVMDVMNS